MRPHLHERHRHRGNRRLLDQSMSPDGVDAPSTALVYHGGGVVVPLREASIPEVATVGLDLAKMVFQVHGADVSGRVAPRTRLRPPEGAGVLCPASAMRRCHGGMCGCLSLGA